MTTREFNPSRRERAVLNLTDMLDDAGAKYTIAGLTPGRMRKMEELGKRYAKAEEEREKAAVDGDDESVVDSLLDAGRAICEQIELWCIGAGGVGHRVEERFLDEENEDVTLTELQAVQEFLLDVIGLAAAEAPNS